MMKKNRILFTLISLFLTSAAFASNPELQGYCPVSYTSINQAVKGDSEWTHIHKGKAYYLADQKSHDAFVANPEQYLPKYGGYCAYGMSFGQKFPGDPKYYTVVDGKLYFNGYKQAHDSFNENRTVLIQKADQNWSRLSR